MKINNTLLLSALLCIVSCTPQEKRGNSETQSTNYDYLHSHFQDPPQEYGVSCWWWWLNGNVTKEAITKDLEAMKSRSFVGAMIFDAAGHTQDGHREIPDGPMFGSEEWIVLFEHALSEAERLGLSLGLSIQSGWNLGGPRVTPEQAAKQLTFSEVYISGGGHISEQLPQPQVRYDYYRDIAVLAFPRDEPLDRDTYIANLNYKLGNRELGWSCPDSRFLLDDSRTIEAPSEERMGKIQSIKKEHVLNITSFMNEDGALVWEAPEGSWVVLRVGYTCTDAHVSTSSNQWQGHVVDYLSGDVFTAYWKDVVDPLLKIAGPRAGTVLKMLQTDSWECGGMNWTDNFVEAFENYCGYDLLPYLPVAAGHIVEDINTTNAFLADFRKTIGDMVANNHYRLFSEYAHKYNLGIQPESGGPHAGPMDAIKNMAFSDIAMSEFWAPSPHRSTPKDRFFVKQASSVAHVYGKRIVGAESFTTIGPHWNDELWRDQKPSFDHELCSGLNRLYFHTFTCSPQEMGLPGQEYFAGTHVNPQVTWWKQSAPFIDYFRRCQLLVQNGKFVGDVLYYYGDHVPNLFNLKESDPAGAMPGFDYDVTGEDMLLQLKVKDGKLLVPGGIQYELLVLPNHKTLSLAVLEKVEELLRQGANVVGPKPENLVSLKDGESGQERFFQLADKLWGEEESESGRSSIGKGVLAWGMTAREFLLSGTMNPDFTIEDIQTHTDFDYIHYVVGESDVYFVCNQTLHPQDITCTFRVSGAQPELWNALNGEISEAKTFTQAEGLTSVPMHLDPHGSLFVVFNKKIGSDEQGSGQDNHTTYQPAQELTGSWEVSFDPAWGGPESIIFPELTDWIEHDHEGIKYYSGKATYKKRFEPSFEPEEGVRYFLLMESIKDVGIAEVRLNGENMGIVWTPPFRLEITQALQSGKNELEIDVVNSWYNRLIGDSYLPEDKWFTRTNITVKERWKLEPSGLTGSVVIETAGQ